MLFSLLSVTVYAADLDGLTKKAQQQDSDSQYQLALLYEQGFGVKKDPEQAFFWFSQAAENGSKKAQQSIAHYYMNGIGTKKDIGEAILWYTAIAANGNTDAQLQLGKLFESLHKPINPQQLAAAWLHAAADSSDEAGTLYNQLLEAKFNKQRAKQISSIEQLNDAFDSQSDISLPPTLPHEKESALSNDYLLWVISSIGLLTLFGMIKSAHKRRLNKRKNILHNDALNARLTNQQKIIEQQQRQLKNAVIQIKKLQLTQPNTNTNTNNSNQNLALSCALFGFNSDTLPTEQQLKTRYKQLCKIYHPDLKGTEEEMKRLNYSLKVILQHLKKQASL
jgi:uncharacterized protein